MAPYFYSYFSLRCNFYITRKPIQWFPIYAPHLINKASSTFATAKDYILCNFFSKFSSQYLYHSSSAAFVEHLPFELDAHSISIYIVGFTISLVFISYTNYCSSIPHFLMNPSSLLCRTNSNYYLLLPVISLYTACLIYSSLI